MKKEYIMYQIDDTDPNTDYIITLQSRDYIVRKGDNKILYERFNWVDKTHKREWRKWTASSERKNAGKVYWSNKQAPWIKKVKELTEKELFIEIL